MASNSAAKEPLPANVHVSRHPCLMAKLSQLRSKNTVPRDVKTLVHEISLIIGCEALATSVVAAPGPVVCCIHRCRRPACWQADMRCLVSVGKDNPAYSSQSHTPLGFSYTTTHVQPQSISLVPILRSGLGMVEALLTLLPHPVPVHHLGMYREPSTLSPVEYYNNLPHHAPSGSSSFPSTPLGVTNDVDPLVNPDAISTAAEHPNANASSLAIILDPVIATGGTVTAAIQTLREWGVRRVVVIAVLGADEGVRRAAAEWPEATDIWLAGLDQELTDRGMLKPGLGDVGDRLFLTIGK